MHRLAEVAEFKKWILKVRQRHGFADRNPILAMLPLCAMSSTASSQTTYPFGPVAVIAGKCCKCAGVFQWIVESDASSMRQESPNLRKK